MEPTRARADRLVVAVGSVLVVAWAAVWIRLGTDTVDGGFAVAIQLRVAQGDLPFVDEFNPLVLGALPAAPFVWAWHELFGLGGLVLASRALFVLATVAVCAVSYRALRTVVGPPAAFGGVALACLALPYDLPVLSYNTVPILGSVLSAAALLATAETRSRRWAVLSGAALGVAALANPQYLPAGIVLGVVAVAWLTADLWLRLLAAAAAPLLAFGVWVLAVPGVGRFRDSLDYLQDTRALVTPASERLNDNLDNLVSQLLAPSYLLLLGVAALVTIGVLVREQSWAVRALLAVLPVAALVPVLRMAWRPLRAGATTSLTSTGDIGVTTLHGSAAVVAVLVVPCAVWLARTRRRSLLVLATFALGLGVVLTPALAASTASGPSRGIAAAGLAVPLLVVVLVATEAAASLRRPVAPAASVAAVAAMVGIATATSFPAVPVGQVDEPVSSGAWAGMQGRPTDIASIEVIGGTLADHTEPGDRVLAINVPAFPLMADVRAGTPMLWLSFWGDSNNLVVDWLEESSHAPEVVLVYSYDAARLADDPALQDDPLARYIRDNFTVVESSTAPPMTVLRRSPG